MAVAFYIPDQKEMLRKAREQEKQLLRLRQWQMATVVLNTIRQLMDSTATVQQEQHQEPELQQEYERPASYEFNSV
ncbi:hypothetical protein AWZ03_005914 [Drosophila navojoa]|uniref:Cell death protein rpr n=1 Tax=Drosophila navojoa TaxID=7232 RepID=A0A484BFI4_DRONA|nr:hypothetical protein AWZ03_005914 [Drosophila navojoa]